MDCDRIIAKRRAKKRIKKLLFVLILIFILFLFLFIYVEIKLAPVVTRVALQRVRAVAEYTVSRAVLDEMGTSDADYDSLVSFEKDNEGKICALTTDTARINKLKSRLSIDILSRLRDGEESIVRIPLGTLLGGDLLAGYGPRITVRIMPVGSIIIDTENVFTSAGINQTRHQMMLRVKTNISVILPYRTIGDRVESFVCISDTVIVGQVPEAFTNVGADEADRNPHTDDIMDYAAHK